MNDNTFTAIVSFFVGLIVFFVGVGMGRGIGRHEVAEKACQQQGFTHGTYDSSVGKVFCGTEIGK